MFLALGIVLLGGYVHFFAHSMSPGSMFGGVGAHALLAQLA